MCCVVRGQGDSLIVKKKKSIWKRFLTFRAVYFLDFKKRYVSEETGA